MIKLGLIVIGLVLLWPMSGLARQTNQVFPQTFAGAKAMFLNDSENREIGMYGLVRFGHRSVPVFAGAMKQDDLALKRSASKALMMLGPLARDAKPVMVSAVHAGDPEISRNALRALYRQGGDSLLTMLTLAGQVPLQDQIKEIIEPWLKETARNHVEEIKAVLFSEKTGEEKIKFLLSQNEQDFQKIALSALGRMPVARAQPLLAQLIPIINGPYKWRSVEACRIIAGLGALGASAHDELYRARGYNSRYVPVAAAFALVRTGARKRGFELFRQLLSSADPRQRGLTAITLYDIGVLPDEFAAFFREYVNKETDAEIQAVVLLSARKHGVEIDGGEEALLRLLDTKQSTALPLLELARRKSSDRRFYQALEAYAASSNPVTGLSALAYLSAKHREKILQALALQLRHRYRRDEALAVLAALRTDVRPLLPYLLSRLLHTSAVSDKDWAYMQGLADLITKLES